MAKKKKAAPAPASASEAASNESIIDSTTNNMGSTSENLENTSPSLDGVPLSRQQQLVLKNLSSGLTDEERAELDALCEADRLRRVGPDPDAVRWPGDLTAEQRAERKAFARLAIADCYAAGGPVDTVVKAATHLNRSFPKAPTRASCRRGTTSGSNMRSASSRPSSGSPAS